MDLLKKGFNIALKYLTYKPRTEYEILEHLKSKEIDKESSILIIGRLKEINYIDDTSYCNSYIENQKNNHKSKKQIVRELEKKGISQNFTIKLMSDLYDDNMEFEIAKLITDKLLIKSEPLSFPQLKNKISYKLKYKEFSNDTIRQVIDGLKDSLIVSKKLEDSTDRLKEKAKSDGIKYFNKYNKKYDNSLMVKRSVLGALYRKGYESKLCYEIINELID